MSLVKKYKRYISWAFLIIIFVFWSYYILEFLPEIKANMGSVDITLFFVSLAVMSVTYFLLAFNWIKLVRATGFSAPFLHGTKGWMLSNVAKYVPGTVWTVLGRGFYAKREKIPLSNTYVSWTLEMYFQLITIIIIVLSYTFLSTLSLEWFILLVLSVIALILPVVQKSFLSRIVLSISRLRLMNRYEKKFKLLSETIGNIDRRGLIAPMISYFVIWLIYGLWFMMLSSSVTGVFDINSILLFTFMWGISWTIGYIIIFVPSGIGIREGVLLSLLLYNGFAVGNAITLSLLTRFHAVILDGLLALLFLRVKSNSKVIK